MNDYSNRNKVQRTVVNSVRDRMLVLGRSGSGLKLAMSEEIANIIEKSVNDSYLILGLSPSDYSSEKIRQQINSIVKYDKSKVQLETFYSFAKWLLKRHGTPIGINSKVNFLSEDSECLELLDEAIKEVEEIKGVEVKDFGLNSKKLLPLFTKLAENNVSHRHVSELLEDWAISNHDIITRIYLQYRKIMLVNMSFDKPSLISEAVTLLTVSKSIRKFIQDINYDIFVTDFYNITHAQQCLLKLLVTTKTNNFYVMANDKKLIDQWDVESVARLIELTQEFKLRISKYPDSMNCPSDISQIGYQLAQQSFSGSKITEYSSFWGNLSNIEYFQILQFKDLTDELQWLASSISSLESDSPKECIVLAKSRKFLEQVVKSLKDHGIDSHITSARTRFESPHMVWFESVIRLANSGINLDYLQQICKSFEILSGIRVKAEDVAMRATLEDVDYLRSWGNTVNAMDDVTAETRDFIENSLIPCLVDRSEFLRFQNFAFSWLNGLAITKNFTEMERQEFDRETEIWNEIVMKLFVEQKKHDISLPILVNELNEQPYSQKLTVDSVPCVTMREFTGGKFQHVFIVGMVEELGSAFNLHSKENTVNSMRLIEQRTDFSTAVTSAEKKLSITCSKKMEGRKYSPSKLLFETKISSYEATNTIPSQ